MLLALIRVHVHVVLICSTGFMAIHTCTCTCSYMHLVDFSQVSQLTKDCLVVPQNQLKGHYTSFQLANGQHLSDFGATSHIWLSSYEKTFDHLLH